MYNHSIPICMIILSYLNIAKTNSHDALCKDQGRNVPLFYENECNTFSYHIQIRLDESQYLDNIIAFQD